VRLIFQRYLELGSLPALQRDLRECGIRTRMRVLSSGRQIGGVPLTVGPLGHILRNRVYLGEINHQRQSYRASTPPFSSRPLHWSSSQAFSSARLFTRGLGRNSWSRRLPTWFST